LLKARQQGVLFVTHILLEQGHDTVQHRLPFRGATRQGFQPRYEFVDRLVLALNLQRQRLAVWKRSPDYWKQDSFLSKSVREHQAIDADEHGTGVPGRARPKNGEQPMELNVVALLTAKHAARPAKLGDLLLGDRSHESSLRDAGPDGGISRIGTPLDLPSSAGCKVWSTVSREAFR
jgi:hypothetical protein